MIAVVLGIGFVSALFLGFGLFLFFRDRHLLRQYTEVGEGIVSGFTEPDDEGFVCPRVQFVHSGGTVTITGSIGSNPPAYRIGQKVPVRYPPGRPDAAILADFQNLYLIEFATIGIGGAGVGTSVLLVCIYLLQQ